MRRGSVMLGDLAGRVAMLEIACRRCEWMRVDQLIEQHGDVRLPELCDVLAGGCPEEAISTSERCSLYYPQLLHLWQSTGKSLDEL